MAPTVQNETQGGGDERAGVHQHMTLTQAVKFAPGRPSVNAMWRWCRRGVKSRTGERIRLEHIRAGGKLLTTAAWVEAFCRRLAQADSVYFAAKDEAAAAVAPRAAGFGTPKQQLKAKRLKREPGPQSREIDEIAGDLEREGL